ncbi:MAG TPA: phage tail tape measure protein, partial [Methanoregula sp.]|nr:phage tail tape measure protein [Methanoregula sp.]
MGLEAFSKGIAFPIGTDLTGLKTGLAEAQGELDKTQAGFTKTLSQNAGKIGMGATIAGGAIVGGFAVATKRAVDFETAMSEVFTLMPGMSKEAMDEMAKQTRDLSVEMGASTDEMVPALYQAISAGIPADNVFEFMRTANSAAVGGVTDLETAVDGITSVINAYGQDSLSATEATDQMFTAVKLGKTNFEELSRSLFNVIPTASSLGVKFGDVSASIAAMTAQGVPTKIATTQMRQALIELSKDGGETSETFQRLSGKTFKEFIAGGGN